MIVVSKTLVIFVLLGKDMNEGDDDDAIPIGDRTDDRDVPVIDHHVGEHSFAVMEDDHDQRRREHLETKPREESEAAEHARR